MRAIVWTLYRDDKPPGERRRVFDYVTEEPWEVEEPPHSLQGWLSAGYSIVSANVASSADNEGVETETTVVVLERSDAPV